MLWEGGEVDGGEAVGAGVVSALGSGEGSGGVPSGTSILDEVKRRPSAAQDAADFEAPEAALEAVRAAAAAASKGPDPREEGGEVRDCEEGAVEAAEDAQGILWVLAEAVGFVAGIEGDICVQEEREEFCRDGPIEGVERGEGKDQLLDVERRSVAAVAIAGDGALCNELGDDLLEGRGRKGGGQMTVGREEGVEVVERRQVS